MQTVKNVKILGILGLYGINTSVNKYFTIKILDLD